MPNQPENTGVQDPKEREIPLPVQLAQQALKLLAAEGTTADEVKKQLPTFAMQLAKSGEAVTVDILLDHARSGEMPRISNPQPKMKTYAEIVAGFPDRTENFFRAVKAGDLDAVRRLVEEDPDISTIQLGRVVAYGHLDIVKYLIEERDENARAHQDDALREAAFNGHLDIVKYLIDECGADVHSYNDGVLYSAVLGGNLGIIKYLVNEHGMDARQCNENPARIAAEQGHLDILKYLVKECNADIHADSEAILQRAINNGCCNIVKYIIEKHKPNQNYINGAFGQAAFKGHLDVVKYLSESGGGGKDAASAAVLKAAIAGHIDILKYLFEEHGVDVHFDDDFALRCAAKEGHLGLVRYLVEERGADIQAGNSVLWHTVSGDYFDVAKYLVEQGDMNEDSLPPGQWARLDRYIAACEVWQKVAHTDPPYGLYTKDPAYFKPAVFNSICHMLKQEGYGRHMRPAYAFNAAGLFGNEERVLQYLEKWGRAGRQPLHDVIHMIKLPEKKTPEMDLAAWGDAVLKCGKSMARLVKFADRLPVPEKTDDGRTWSMIRTREKVAQFAYEKASENIALAALCMEHDVDEEAFNMALKLAGKAPAVKDIPDIAIDGVAFDLPGATFHRLAADDIRGLFLGEMTDCCQSIGGFGAACAAHGFKSQDSGFYVVENAKGRVIGQTWAWRGKKGELVFDSLETLGENVSPLQWQKLATAFKKALAKNPDNVTALHIGKGGATPESLTGTFNEASSPAQPVGYNGYRDSHQQVVVWQRMKA